MHEERRKGPRKRVTQASIKTGRKHPILNHTKTTKKAMKRKKQKVIGRTRGSMNDSCQNSSHTPRHQLLDFNNSSPTLRRRRSRPNTVLPWPSTSRRTTRRRRRWFKNVFAVDVAGAGCKSCAFVSASVALFQAVEFHFGADGVHETHFLWRKDWFCFLLWLFREGWVEKLWWWVEKAFLKCGGGCGSCRLGQGVFVDWSSCFQVDLFVAKMFVVKRIKAGHVCEVRCEVAIAVRCSG